MQNNQLSTKTHVELTYNSIGPGDHSLVEIYQPKIKGYLHVDYEVMHPFCRYYACY